MKYLGKLLLEGIVVTLAAGVILFIVIYFFGETILDSLKNTLGG